MHFREVWGVFVGNFHLQIYSQSRFSAVCQRCKQETNFDEATSNHKLLRKEIVGFLVLFMYGLEDHALLCCSCTSQVVRSKLEFKVQIFLGTHRTFSLRSFALKTPKKSAPMDRFHRFMRHTSFVLEGSVTMFLEWNTTWRKNVLFIMRSLQSQISSVITCHHHPHHHVYYQLTNRNWTRNG